MEEEFGTKRLALENAILSTLHAHGAEQGFGPLRVDALHQCQVSIEEFTQELLLFGFDQWPEGT